MITHQTWLNLRAEYTDELTYQFALREKIDALKEKEQKATISLIENSSGRCQAMDLLIQSNAEKFKTY